MNQDRSAARGRRRRVARAVAVALALVLALVACSDEPEAEEDQEISVTGGFGAVPVVTFDAPLPLEDQSVETLVEGEGRELDADDPVLLSLTAYDGDSGRLLEDREPAVPQIRMLTPEDVGEDLFDVLTGTREGSRLLLQQPVEENGEERMLVLVVDVRYTQAHGEEVEPRAGLPEVELDGREAPSIDVPGGEDPPSELTIAPLIRGGGPQVRPGQQVIVQYTGVSWESGDPYDSTWEGGGPQPLVVDEVFEGLRYGLVDQPVGSQVLLVIPPGLALDDETLVLVVDVLATVGGEDEEAEG